MTRSAPGHAAPTYTPLVLASLAATWFVWGSTYLAIKIAIVAMPPFLLMATRFLLAGGLLLAYTRWRGLPWPSTTEWRNAALVGTLMLGCGMQGPAHAEASIGSGLVVAFIAVTPLLMVLAQLPFGARPRRGELLGVLVGLVGVIMLVRGAGFSASPSGLAWMLLGCTGWTAGSVLSQRQFALAPGAVGFASEMLCGGLAQLAGALLVGERWPAHVSGTAWLAWAYLIVFGSLIAFNAYMYLLGRASAAIATSYTYVNPIIALLLGVLFAGEQVTSWEWLSSGVVLVGVVLLLASRR